MKTQDSVRCSSPGPWLRPFATAAVFFVWLVSGVSAQTPVGWRASSPGFSAQVLLFHENAMWTAGSGGTIAVSTDGGQHWQKKHEDVADGLVLALAFTNARFGYAAGTGTRLLMTEDGGETWSAGMQVPETVYQAAFGDPAHGVIRTRSALLATTDGGKSWKPVSPDNDPSWSEKYPNTLSLAALDSSHLIVRVREGEYNDGEFLWTGDSGATWHANYLPNGAGGGQIFVAGGKYWSIGGEVVGKDHPGGGLNIPMAVRSADGVEWEHLPVYRDACHWTGCGGCTPQGCFAGGSSFVPFSRILETLTGEGANSAESIGKTSTESLAHFPGHLLSNQWARTDNTLCLLTHDEIECTTLTPAATLDTKGDQAEWDGRGFPPLRETGPPLARSSIQPALKPGVHCIRCDLVRLVVSKEGNSGPVAIQFSFRIETSGKVSHCSLSGDLPKDVRAKLEEAAAGWLFEPYMENGRPKTTSVNLRGQIFVMNPDRPLR